MLEYTEEINSGKGETLEDKSTLRLSEIMDDPEFLRNTKLWIISTYFLMSGRVHTEFWIWLTILFVLLTHNEKPVDWNGVQTMMEGI